MVARKARKDGVDLPSYFWNTEKYKREFLLQLRHVLALLKLYSPDAIVRALRTRKGKTLYSFGAKFALDPLIRDEQTKIDRVASATTEAKETVPERDEVTTSQAPRPAFQPTNRSSLKDL